MMNNAGEPVLVCPYNKAHSIIKSRMQFHLAKCRKQNRHSETAICPFNSTHVVAKVELEFHEMVCENRIVLDSFVFNVGNSKCPVEEVPVNVPPEMLAPCEENWDEEQVPSVLEMVKEKAKERTVLLNLIGAPKAERKAHRVQERLRFQRVADAQESEKKKKEKSVNHMPKRSDSETNEPENKQENNAHQKFRTSEEGASNRIIGHGSNSDSDLEKTTDYNQTPQNDDFEVVNYHKKVRGKKGKQQYTQIIPLKPSNNLTTKYERERNTECVVDEKFANLNIDNKIENVAEQLQTTRRAADVKLTVNAWKKPLNISGGTVTPTPNIDEPAIFRPADDFPSLPVSGRGRGIHLNKKY